MYSSVFVNWSCPRLWAFEKSSWLWAFSKWWRLLSASLHPLTRLKASNAERRNAEEEEERWRGRRNRWRTSIGEAKRKRTQPKKETFHSIEDQRPYRFFLRKSERDKQGERERLGSQRKSRYPWSKLSVAVCISKKRTNVNELKHLLWESSWTDKTNLKESASVRPYFYPLMTNFFPWSAEKKGLDDSRVKTCTFGIVPTNDLTYCKVRTHDNMLRIRSRLDVNTRQRWIDKILFSETDGLSCKT